MERSFGSKYGKWIALTAVVLALVLWFVLSGGVENYRAKYEGYDLSQQIGDIGRSSTYSLYLRAHEGAPDASSDVSIPLVTVDSDGVTAQKDGLLMQSGSSATFAVTVPETGFYNIRLTYRTEAARGVDLERELRINGEVPFDGADTLTFTACGTTAAKCGRTRRAMTSVRRRWRCSANRPPAAAIRWATSPSRTAFISRRGKAPSP